MTKIMLIYYVNNTSPIPPVELKYKSPRQRVTDLELDYVD